MFLVRQHPPQSCCSSFSPPWLKNYPALRNLTFIISLLSCALQISSFFHSSQAGGVIGDSDFLTNLQTFFMQLLTTYTSLVPAIRIHLLRNFASAFWVSFLCVATFGLNLASVVVYTYRAPLSPLLSFFGAVVQATTVLQLATRIEAMAPLEDSNSSIPLSDT